MFDEIIKWMDNITIIVSFITLFFVIKNWKTSKNKIKLENQKIKIYFDVEGVDYLLDLDIPRKQISRSEIQGVLSAFQQEPTQRYSIEYLSDINFLDDIYKVQNNEINKIKIIVSPKELNGWKKDEQSFHDGFNLNKMKKQ